MLVRRAEMLDIECIVRGYLAGSAWEEYETAGTVHGTAMPAGLAQADRLPEPIFTPSTKATEGHDLNIDFAEAVDLVGQEAAEAARGPLPRAAYSPGRGPRPSAGHRHLADTKFELGFVDGELCLCDEVLHARLVPLLAGRRGGAPGTNPPAFDKQPLRDWLAAQPWDKHAAPAAAARRGRDGHVGPVRRGLRARQRPRAGRLVRCRAGLMRVRTVLGARRGAAAARASPTRRAPPSSGRCPRWASTASPTCGPGKSFRFEVDAADEAAALAQATELADRLLANPVIEESR